MAKDFRVYRANKTNSGVASSWQLSYKDKEKFDKYMMFLQMAKQSPDVDKNNNAQFLWKEGVTVKLGENDIGQILAVLERRQELAKLFHESPDGGNKVINLTAVENGYTLYVSAKAKDAKDSIRFNQTLSFGEASILCTLIKTAIQKIYGW